MMGLFSLLIAAIGMLAVGGALAGRFDYAAQLIFVLAIWTVQLVVSPLWLQRFRFGPAEWVWRTLMYGRAQPMSQEAPGVDAT